VRDRLQYWRVWLGLRLETSGLRILFIGVAAVLSLALALLVTTRLPVGPVTVVEGRIMDLGYRESERGSVRTASVELEDGMVRTAIPERFGCRVGDRVRLQRRPLRSGYSHGIGTNPRPCSTA